MTEQIVTPNMGAIAKQLRKFSGRGRMVLIGPTRIWTEPKSGRDMYGVCAVTHDKTGRECLFDSMIFFGGVAGEPPQAFVDACDVVLLVKRADEVTKSEADKLRNDLIGHCRSHFKRVFAFNSERELVDAMVTHFPGEKSERLHRAIHADATSV